MTESNKYFHSKTELKYRKIFMEVISIRVFVKVGGTWKAPVIPFSLFFLSNFLLSAGSVPPTFTPCLL